MGLLVVDEAHCVSDWGHDFRPDYRRIGRVLVDAPRTLPVLCTTATANNRVIDDIGEQLGDLDVVRGSLGRPGLRLAVVDLPRQADRLAWLASIVPQLPGSGIVYCLTVHDTERVAGWLRAHGVDALAYSGRSDDDVRVACEQSLLDNGVKAVVATSALGMGFDKPDLAFVIHYQSPGSPITYYQQVGRAGRALDRADAILLRGAEGERIQDYFIETAFPPRAKAEQIVRLLADVGEPMPLLQIEQQVNVRRTRIETMLKVLEVDGAVERVSGGWQRTLRPWAYDTVRVDGVTAHRRQEQEAMRRYGRLGECRMAFLRQQLDDPEATACGWCDVCTGTTWHVDLDPALVSEADRYLRSQVSEIEPRKRWAACGGGPTSGIPEEHRLLSGRALCRYGDGGWGDVVRRVKYDGVALP